MPWVDRVTRSAGFLDERPDALEWELAADFVGEAVVVAEDGFE